jgi:PTS system nitrogen regulatory IIA component
MRLSELLLPECIAQDLRFADKESVLQGIAKLAKKANILKDVTEKEILQGLRRREQLGSTGFGSRISIPHCRLARVPEFIVGIATTREGVDFDAMDGKEVHVFLFMIAPERETSEHLRILSEISQILHTPGIVDRLLAAKTPEALREVFLAHALVESDGKGDGNRHMFHIFVEGEDLFEDLLNTLASIGPVSMEVVASESARRYLVRMPLFAGLWSNSSFGLSQVIIAVVQKSITNELIRRIERVTGKLDNCSRVMVVVQEPFYSAGSLEV